MCSQDQLAKDLRELSLDEVLEKHGITLKELFTIQSGVVMNRSTKTRREESTYIRQTKQGRYVISKTVNNQNVYYGTYMDKKEAEAIVEELKKCFWDKKQLPRILTELNIKTKSGDEP